MRQSHATCMSQCDSRPEADHVVSSGPFHDLPPLDLWQQIAPLPDGKFRSGDEVRAAAQTWLRATLEDADVELGDYDQEVVALLAKECTSTVQVVAGWIKRARATK